VKALDAQANIFPPWVVVFLSDIEDIPENRELQPYKNYAQYVKSEEEAINGEDLDRRLNTIWSGFSFNFLY
jgi:hypothetical protein